MTVNCSICHRILNQEHDPLSVDCGGNCWGCIGEIEAEMGDEYATRQLIKEFKAGLRNDWLPSPKIKFDKISATIEVYLETPLGLPCTEESIELLMYSELMFKRTKIYFDELVMTDSKGFAVIQVDKKRKFENDWCKITRGNRSWTYPVGKLYSKTCFVK